jgi:hypothetical protein
MPTATTTKAARRFKNWAKIHPLDHAMKPFLFDELLQGWIAQPAPELKVTALQLAPWHLPHIGHRQTPFANDFL